MTKKEQKREEQELADAVRTLRATLRSIAHRKARRYEHEFLVRVRDMIDQELGGYEELNEIAAEFVGREVVKEITKE